MVNVKSAKPDEVNREEMETVYRALAKDYCVCQHKKSKHRAEEYECEQEGMVMEGGIQTFKCECKLFISLEDKALETPSSRFSSEQE